MTISQIEKQLAEIKAQHGDLECLIEMYDWRFEEVINRKVQELSVEEREGFGLSLKFLQ